MFFSLTESINEINASPLPTEEKENLIGVVKGEKIPPLTSDVIVKKILSPEEHPDRLDYLLQKVMNEPNIKVKHSAANEGQLQNQYSKKVISDIPAWLKDHRLADLEIQVAAQDYIFDRTDIYSANMLMIQYSAEKGQKKEEVNYSNVNGVVIVVLMKNSPDIFKNFDSMRYIHRITKAYADSGMVFNTLRKIVFVQLDRALDEFLNDSYEKDEDYELLKLLATLADPNNNKVKQVVNDESMLKEMCEEAFDFSQSREVQAMLLAEKMAIADWNSAKETAKAEGRAEGLAEGQEETNKLYSWLLSADRIEDAKKATKDVAYRKQLLDELNSIK